MECPAVPVECRLSGWRPLQGRPAQVMLIKCVCGTELRGKSSARREKPNMQKNGLAGKANLNRVSTLQKGLTVEDKLGEA